MVMPRGNMSSPSSSPPPPIRTLQLRPSAVAVRPGPPSLQMSPMKIVVTPYTPEHHEVTMLSLDHTQIDSSADTEDEGFVMMTHSDPDEDDIDRRDQGEDQQIEDALSELDEEEESESEYETESSSIPLEMLFGLSAQCNEDIVFAENGYKKLSRLCTHWLRRRDIEVNMLTDL